MNCHWNQIFTTETRIGLLRQPGGAVSDQRSAASQRATTDGHNSSPHGGKASEVKVAGILHRFAAPADTTSLFVPLGTLDNSPPFQRWDQPGLNGPSPVRGDRSRCPRGVCLIENEAAAAERFCRPCRDSHRRQGVKLSIPPLKRWAIFGSPSGTKTRK